MYRFIVLLCVYLLAFYVIVVLLLECYVSVYFDWLLVCFFVFVTALEFPMDDVGAVQRVQPQQHLECYL